MRLNLLLLTLTISFFSFAQTGPGGIQSTDGLSNMIMWLDANQVTGITNGNNVTTWEDLSGFDNDASQSLVASKPNWFDNVVNGFPYVFFDGLERLEGTLNTGLTAPTTLVAVCYFDSLTQTDNDWVVGIGSTNSMNSSMNIARRTPGANTDEYFQWDGDNSNYGPVLPGQQWMMITHVQASSAPYHSMYLDGTAQVVDDFATNALSTNTDFRIGDAADSPGASYRLAGKIPEVVMFNKILNTAELNILHSYLGAKYNIANGGDQYTGDNSGNGDNDRDVIGIGTEADGSNTAAQAAGLHLEQVSGFGNGDYVMAGHAVETNTVNSADVGGGYDARWDRAYWFEVTNSGAPTVVDILFDYSEAGMGSNPDASTPSDYQLIYRASTSGAWTTIASATSVSGNQVSFDGVSLSSTGFYTLGTLDNSASPLGLSQLNAFCNGPGGIGDKSGTSNLHLWLDPFEMKPENDDPLAIFTDFSGYDNPADVISIINVPTLNTSVVNGMPVARFDGNNWVEGDLDSPLGSPSTVISVGYFNTDQGSNDNDYIISIGNPTTSQQHCSIGRRRNNVAADANKYYAWDGSATYFGPVISTATWNIFLQENRATSPYHGLDIDGTTQTVANYSNPFNAVSPTYRIGMWQNGNNSGLNGDIGEVIIFDRLLNSAEKNIINSYLSAKFNIGLPVSVDKYTGDDPANDNHDLYVVGVGTESDGSNDCANSVGMRMSRSNNFGNGDYVMWGTNDLTNFINFDDVDEASDLIDARWERSWWVDVTNVGGGGDLEVDITFDYSDAGEMGYPDGDPTLYYLLYRAGTTGNWTILSIGSSISGDQVNFNNISLTADGYYTLGTRDILTNPLPITLVDFDVTAMEEKRVKIDWATESEYNNDFFTVERSDEGLEWERIALIDGAGNSVTKQSYEHWDNTPLIGTSYYRLGQTDFDGNVQYTPIKSVNFEGIEIISAHPNPSDGDVKIIINLTGSYDFEISVYSILGQEVYHSKSSEMEGFIEKTLDLKYLNSGTYILKIRTSDGESFDQTRIQLN